MKIYTPLILTLILIIFNQNVSFPQQTENWLERNDPIHYRKLYLHTDREFYFLGDSIWYKAYYLDGQTNRFISGFYSMYTDLVDKNGLTIQSQVLLIANGVTVGNMKIPHSLEPGKYLLRAYTDFQKRIGEDAFFYKTLKISKVKSSFELTENNSTNEQGKKPEIDVAFLPEGGFLLAGQMNVVGIKAVDKHGRGISVEGKILNNKGKIVIFFTEYKGMGKIYLNPREGEIYKVKIDNYPDYEYEFSDIIKDGIKIEYIGKSEDNLLFQVTTNSRLFQGENYYFAIMHHGKVVFYQEFVQKKKDFGIKVNQSVLPAGINRFVLLDKQLQPISERLLFSKNFGINNVEIRLNQDQYETRSNVQLEIFDEEEISDMDYSDLSVTVVDETAAGENGPALNILSWLLIDSELKGNIESPSDFFVDDSRMSSEDKLNLLMLTQGWSRYLWNSIPDKNIVPDFHETEGITVTGSVQKILGKKPVVNGLVSLSIFSNDYFMSDHVLSDENGRFTFDNIYFTDTASVFLQALNEKGKLSTEVFLDPVFIESPGVSKLYLPATEIFTDVPVELYRQQYYNERAMREYLLKSGSIWIDEITVIGEKREEDDGHFRIYSKPSTSFKVTDLDLRYHNVFDYLQTRTSGVSGGPISLIGGSGKLCLLNGIQVSADVLRSIPMSNIDVVDVIKHYHIGELAIFGTRGAGGVIAVYTKKGTERFYETHIPGTIAKKIAGYAPCHEFYSPKYTPKNIDTEKPDHRITLYWNPEVITVQGKACVSFFTSDDISRFRVFVEGVTNSGKICLGTSAFEVNTNYSNLDK